MTKEQGFENQYHVKEKSTLFQSSPSVLFVILLHLFGRFDMQV